jgi:hypothetical protein
VIREFADFLYGAGRVAAIATKRFPGEPIFLASGATVLKTKDTTPVGKSPQRYLQLRGAAVFTDRRVFCKAPWLSPALVIYLPVLAYCAYAFFTSGDAAMLLAGVLSLILLVQRRPFEVEVPLQSLTELRIAKVSGMAMRGDLVVLGLGTHGIQVVTAQRLPDDLRRFLLHQADLARRRGLAAA